ncbi:MAG: hypothetical protein WCJ35_03845 [Planctomycetota bacterium]
MTFLSQRFHADLLWLQATQHLVRFLFCILGFLAVAGREASAADQGRTAQGQSGSFTKADFEKHIEQLQKKIPSKDFTVVLTPPFVVIGDESPEEVRRRSKETVNWAVEKLKKAYFKQDPRQILDIWLFKDKKSYEANCKKLFGKTPDTPFGYFSQEDGALVMNISTGGGTLVHEIVHPFVAANFPNCPAWFNEGLGSLYEQSGELDGEIHGYTNWRLPRLQDAIRKGKLTSFKTLCQTTDTDFYEKDRGTNYAQARYLCYYLQQKDLLKTYYRSFLADRKDDPSGYKTLKAILKSDDMNEFQKQWESYVLKLKYPNRE